MKRLKKKSQRILRNSTKDQDIEDQAINLQGEPKVLIHLMMISLSPSMIPSQSPRPPNSPTKYQRKRDPRKEELTTKKRPPTLMTRLLQAPMMRRI